MKIMKIMKIYIINYEKENINQDKKEIIKNS